ncbi:MAG: ArsA-related P-loop ATPase [Acidobacteriota bacterium]
MVIRICVGTGGVGKTTVATAVGLNLARQGRRTLLLTIDPARRLRTLLGLEAGAGEHRVRLGEDGADLWAALLDVEYTLAQAVRQYGDPRQAAEVLDHPVFHMLISSLAGMEELMAIECLDQAFRKGFEAIVVDTAPSRHAFEFLDKPEFFADLVSFRVVKLVGRSYRLWAASPLGRLGRTSFDLYSRIEDLVGARVVGQVLDFYSLFRTIAEGYAERARATVRRLRDPRECEFIVVTAPSKAERDVEFFREELAKRRFPVRQIVVNRCWPSVPADLDADSEFERQTLEWYRGIFSTQQRLLTALRTAISGAGMQVVSLPELPTPPLGLDGVEQLADALE